jgi:predicted transcriptional regulator
MSAPRLGDQELVLLRWLAAQGPVSVGQAAAEFGAAHRLARSTILTMMERLRAKGHLVRRRASGVFVYSAVETSERTVRHLVHGFVEDKLEGSVSPFVSYLVERAEVSDAELAELEALVARLQSRRGARKERRK